MKKRVEITEVTGVRLGRLVLAEGDVVSLDADIADLIIQSGWGKNAATGEQGERKEGAQRLTAQDVITKIDAL